MEMRRRGGRRVNVSTYRSLGISGGCEVKSGSSAVHAGISDMSGGGLGGGHVETGELRRGSVEMSAGKVVVSVGGGGGDDGWEINAHD